MRDMESAGDMQPVTRAEFRSGLRSLKDEVEHSMTVLIDGLRTEIKHEITELKATDSRLAVEMVKMRSEMATKADMREIKESIESLKGLVIESAEKGWMYYQKALTHGHQLMEHESSINDHERRISKLEGNA